jgi:hypothetical protein
MSGKPTVATVPPSFTGRLAAMGNGLNVSAFFLYKFLDRKHFEH